MKHVLEKSAMSVTIGTQHIEKLNYDTNYESWKIQIKSILVCNELWKYTSGDEISTPENRAVWTSKDEKALALILLSISKNQLNHVKKVTTSHAAWEKLKSIYESRGPVRKSVLYKQLYRMKEEQEQSMMDYVSSFVDKIEHLEDAGIKLPDELASIILLNSLPPEYENFCVAMESRDHIPTIDFLKTKLIEEEVRRIDQNDSKGYNSENNALTANNKGSNKNAKDAHTKSYKFTGKCYKCNKIGHKSADCRSKSKRHAGNNTQDAMFACAQYAGSQKSTQWCLDSGATSHMCHNKGKFQGLDADNKCDIYTATEDSVKSRGTGNVEMKVKLRNSKVNNINLKDTILVPQFKNNLLSVSRMTDNGYTVTFKRNCAFVNRQDGTTALIAKRQGQLYVVDEAEQPKVLITHEAEKDSFLRWHQRFGHLNPGDLKRLKSHDMVKGLNIKGNPMEFDCEICDKCKIHRLPYKSSTTREKEVLGLVHSDICGPMTTPSLGGARYLVTFIDDKSRYIEVAMLKKRSDVLAAFKAYKKRVEKETGHQIKRIRTDNGKEYLSKEFNDFLEDEGIKRQLSVEYCPQQNGVAERANRTLVEMARCMMSQSGVPNSLWAEAINTAAYIRNRCPTKALANSTPIEVWSTEKPYVGFMRIFGSKVVALEKKPSRGKFEPKGKEYILVGYSQESKAYRLWNPGTKTIVKRRDVRFVEDLKEKMNDTEEDEDFTALLNPDWHESKKSQKAEPEESIITGKINDNTNSEQDLDDDTEETEQVQMDTPKTSKRGPGRPKLLKTGKRGRPRKIHHEITYKEETSDKENSEDIEKRTDRQE